MKICPNCNTQIDDNSTFCTNCGVQFVVENQGSQYQQVPNYNTPPQPGYAPMPKYDPYDHTTEFSPQDISDNKVIAMLVYLMGAIGVIIALLASNTSKYVSFHLRQALKFLVVEILMPIVLIVGAVICIIPILGWIVYALVALAVGIAYIIFFVLKIICFFQICSGKAKEPVIIRNLKFLK